MSWVRGLEMTAIFSDREAAGIMTFDHARLGAVEADETEPSQNPFGAELMGEKFLIPESVLQSQDHRLLA